MTNNSLDKSVSLPLYYDDYTKSHGTNIYSQIRRLKMHEKILSKDLTKSDSTCINLENKNDANLDSKTFVNTIKEMYDEINELFLAFQSNISIEENLEEIDINEVKTEVYTLDAKIKELKILTESEFNILKQNEGALQKEIEANNHDFDQLKAGVPRAKIKASASVLCPTKVIMQSPCKYREVQNFQDFMKESPNRYGGWNEYNHNLFVQVWKKYFKLNDISETDLSPTFTENEMFYLFSKEVEKKISGLKLDNIVAHSQWYARFLHLKEEQQRAVNRWRSNQDKINNIPRGKQKREENYGMIRKQVIKPKPSILSNSTDNSMESPMSIASNDKEPFNGLFSNSTDLAINFNRTENKDQFFIRLSQPKNKLPRGNWNEFTSFQFRSLDNIQKVGIPPWRKGLSD